MRPPENVVELMGLGDLSQGALRKSSQSVNGVISNVRQYGRLANLCSQRVESAWNQSMLHAIKQPTAQGFRKLRRSQTTALHESSLMRRKMTR
jgi:hypothetical protein